MKLKHLDLFSGIGGFSLGLERTGGFKTVAFCEIDPFCQKVLKKHWPDVPIHEDVRSLEYDGSVDIITGGYPCQPFSLAGNRKGAEDDRHLWPSMFDLVKKHRPSWVIGENVPGHIHVGLDGVLADLESEGYGCRVFVIPACAVDAPHRRDRVWIIANTNKFNDDGGRYGASKVCRERSTPAEIFGSKDVADSERSGLQGYAGYGAGRGKPGRIETQERGSACPGGLCEDVMADPHSDNGQRRCGSLQVGRERKPGKNEENGKSGGIKWLPEPAVGRVANGIPSRVDRLKSLGNAVVPQIPEIIGHAILEAEK